MSDDVKSSPDEEAVKILDSIGEILANNEIETAVITFIDPDTKEIRLMTRGQFYEAAKLLGKASNQIRRQIAEDLNGLF